MPLLGPMGGCFWGSQAEAELVDLHQKEPGFGGLHRGFHLL